MIDVAAQHASVGSVLSRQTLLAIVLADEWRSSDKIVAATHGGTAISGTLTVGLYTTISPIVMPQLIEHFSRAHPMVTLVLEEGSQLELVRELRDATIDIAIMYDGRLDPGLTKLIVVLVYPARHPLERASTVDKSCPRPSTCCDWMIALRTLLSSSSVARRKPMIFPCR